MRGAILAIACGGCSPQPGVLAASGPVVCALATGRIRCETVDREGSYSTEVEMDGVTSLSMGGLAVCARTRAGEARCDGFGMVAGLLSPPPGPWSTVVAGHSHACAFGADGTPTCWGADFDNALVVPAGVRLGRIIAGDNRTCGTRLEDDTWLCWGADTSYLERMGVALGVPEPGTVLTQFDMHGGSLFGVRSDGSLGYWGVPGDQYGREAVPEGTGFVKVDAGTRYACALHESGRVECWGDMRFGQDAVPDGTFTDVAAGDTIACATDERGVVTCWGCEGACVEPHPELW